MRRRSLEGWRADAMSLARLFVLLAVIALGRAAILGMRPVVLPTLGSAAIHVAVLAPLVVTARLLGGALRRRWAGRRFASIGAALIGEALPVLVWLPVFLLAYETHRAQSTVAPEDVGIDWPRERVTFAGAGGTRLVGCGSGTRAHAARCC